jgi:hypothetical protein
MRCRKVRSFLSAYCKGELPEKRTGAISDHLEGCPRCRFEETAYREMSQYIDKLPKYSVSEDFNSRLLKRIAEERFSETRSRAYLPKKIPVLTFNRLAPLFAAACFVFAFMFSGGLNLLEDKQEPIKAVTSVLNDDYLTTQPKPDHILNQHLAANWAFNEQIARVNRIRGLMTRLAGQNSFGSLASSSANQYYMPPFYRIQQYYPNLETNSSPASSWSKEVNNGQ